MPRKFSTPVGETRFPLPRKESTLISSAAQMGDAPPPLPTSPGISRENSGVDWGIHNAPSLPDNVGVFLPEPQWKQRQQRTKPIVPPPLVHHQPQPNLQRNQGGGRFKQGTPFQAHNQQENRPPAWVQQKAAVVRHGQPRNTPSHQAPPPFWGSTNEWDAQPDYHMQPQHSQSHQVQQLPPQGFQHQQQQDTSQHHTNSNMFLEGYVAAMSAVQRQTAEFLANANNPQVPPAVTSESSAYPQAQQQQPSQQKQPLVPDSSDEGIEEDEQAPRFLPTTEANRETTITVDGASVHVTELLPNRATDLILDNPKNMVGRYCRQQGPHSPYECTFIHRAEITIEGETLPLSAFAPGVAVEFMLSCRGVTTARWCTDANPHEVWSCRYLHPRKGKSGVTVSGRHVPKEVTFTDTSKKHGDASNDQEAALTQVLAETGETVSEVMVVGAGVEHSVPVSELLRNPGLEGYLKNPNRPGKICHNKAPHLATDCGYLHYNAVPIDGGLDGLQERGSLVQLSRLVPNVAVDYLLRHPTAVGRLCGITIPHDVGMCTYIHPLPNLQPQEDAKSGSLDTWGNYAPLNCPCCAAQFEMESLRLRGWCQECGVEWQTSPKYGSAPRIVAGRGPSLIDRFSDTRSSHHSGNSEPFDNYAAQAVFSE